MEYDFCSICGKKYIEDNIPMNPGEWRTLHKLDFSLINGTVICHNCWRKRQNEI
jgi:hypothetical protein